MIHRSFLVDCGGEEDTSARPIGTRQADSTITVAAGPTQRPRASRGPRPWGADGARTCQDPFVRPVIQSIIDELYARHHRSGRVDLNDIAEIIGARSVSYEEVDHIVDRLEALGLVVGEPIDVTEVSVMKRVLTAARTLRSSLGRTPTIAEVALSSGHPVHVVRRALERGVSPRVVRSY
jgi:hypothetical protein